ncbi:VOC family protein [Mycobacterium sp. NAZ190054]|uniref:VOC family protein n=1 Tax=Mycobacterium sp. NAZ190054 TaxID=1747766 RepID=UPI000791CCCA|nr:VOC family protein [Mycobacterium sp. NAZ190054]KWX57578.1 hypothetical protein ASJ79_11135 [Mycobacterium sp. NAZ190054]
MITRTGNIAQLGFVVSDLGKAVKHWVEFLKVGPFFVAEEIKPDSFTHRGQASDATFAAALANTGDMQIELIQPLGDSPSLWHEFAASGRQGLQHVAYWTDEFDKEFQAAQNAGYRLAHGGVLSGGRFVYFETDDPDGYAVELSEQSPAKRAVFDAIRNAAVGWDGSVPIRPWSEALDLAAAATPGPN